MVAFLACIKEERVDFNTTTSQTLGKKLSDITSLVCTDICWKNRGKLEAFTLTVMFLWSTFPMKMLSRSMATSAVCRRDKSDSGCIYVCVCIYIHVHVCMYLYTYTCVYVCIYIHVRVCMYVFIYMYVCMHMYVSSIFILRHCV